ncbi:ankyrin-2 [Galendromus occidentalis]|uniref:Ankyrin-2 n=1 Tax=Galendromus occidentalis TaxID=34638 RepID=A0AAJ7SFN8_9ACAR|nr:ankyrin-2 [Galendromus occidentalis]
MVTKDSDNKENAPGEKPPQIDNSASFLRAARAGNLEKVLEYLKGSIDINTSNANGLNALHLASKEGHVLVVKELLQRGAEVNAATKKGNTALHIASLAGQADVVQVLVEKGANVNVQSQNGFTPLYMAAQENHDAVVRFLLANNANQSLATEDGFTPLAVALQQGHDKVVAVLLENDAKGKVRLPALHIAAKKDDTKAAALLLQNEHNPDVTSKSGFTPLHIAAHYGNANIAAQLLEKGADVNFPAKHNISPLHVAAKWGKQNMVKLLLDKGAQLDSSTRDGLTPLHCAARSGHDQVVDQLIDKGAPITAKTKNGLAPLHMASQGDHVESAKILLNHKAPVDDITVDYLTALHVAAHCGHVGVAKLLLDKKADANSRALNGFTPLHIACKKNRIKVVELLLRHGASIEATTESGLTPLHVASFMGCMNIVIYLIQHGANADVPTVRGETPLHLAARANQTDIVRILLRNGAQVDTRAREQQTPLHIAARLGNVDIVCLLLQHGANVDSATKDQYTSLHIAAKEGQEDVVNMLLEHGASVTAATKKGFTPLHLAAKYGHLKVGKLLLQRDAPVDAQGKNGVTPLHVAAHYDYNNIALLLLERGGSPHAAAKNGYTPLHIAAKKNQMDIGTTLLEYGAKTNAESKAGFTSLHLAAQEGFADHAALLIEHGANVNAAAKNGLTPLHLCAQEDKVNVAAVLAKNNCQIDPMTAAGYTPLHVACHFGQTNMIKFLLQHGADVNAATTQGYTPLHQAAQQGHAIIINLLLENRAQPNATTKQGQTALSIAERLGYISVIETLKVVTETTVTTTTTVVTEEKYKVVAPETMHETFMSDSEDEAEQDNMMGDHSFKYLTADEMKSLGDDSLPIDVTRDEKAHEAHVAHMAQQAGHIAPSAVEEDRLSPSHLDSSFAKAAPDNVEVKRTPVHAGGEGKLKWKTFLVSFMVDARGGAMRGCRHSGVRVIIPPRRATMPMRVTCRFIRKEKLSHPPPLMEGEACAARVIEMGPAGAKFLGPVVIEVPHFASLRGKEREIVILRSDNGETWKEHTLEATEDAVSEVLNGSFDAQELNAMQDFNTSRVTRILTTDFPQFFAVVCRNRQEVHSIGPEGGMVSSTVVSQVQAIFPEGALTKKIKVGLQAQPIHTEMVTRLLGNRVAVSPIVTVEPRRRKFHKPITLTIPLPKAAHKGMTNQYQNESPTLRLLCSITGGQTKAQWEDVTGSTPLTFVSECVSFTTTVSARFWLIDCRQITDVTKFATELYHEAVLVPFMAKFVVFAKRHELLEAQLRVFCMTDDREDKTLENQEHFAEVAKSRDVEVLEGTEQYLEFAGNLVPITKSGDQLALTFEAFKENRVSFNARVKDMHQEPMGRVAFMKDPRGKHQDVPQNPVCNLNIRLPEPVEYESVPLEKKYGFVRQGGAGDTHEMIHRADLHLSDIAKEVGNDWAALAGQLGIPVQEIQQIRDEVANDKEQQTLTMLKIWIQRMGPAATGNALEKALQNIGRDDIVHKCMSNIEVVTDDVEKAVAKVHLSGPGSITSVTKTTVVTTSSTDERDIMKDAESAEDTSSGSARTKPTATPAPVEAHEVHQTTIDVKRAESKKERTPELRKEKSSEKSKTDSKKTKEESKKDDSKKQSPKREIPPPPKKEPPKKEKKEDPPKKDATASKKDAKKESLKKKEETKKESSPAPPKKETSPPKKEPSPAPPKKEPSPPRREAKAKEESRKPEPKKDSPKKEAPKKEEKKIKSPSAAPPEPPKKPEEKIKERVTALAETAVSEVIQKTELPSTASPQKKKREGTPVDELSAELLEQIVRDDQDLALKGGASKKAARDVIDAGPGGVMGRNVDIETYIKETTPEEIVIPEYRQETRTVTMTSMTTTVTREGIAARTSKEEESGPGAEAMSFIEKKEYFETLATETAEVLSPTQREGGAAVGDFGRRLSQERQMTSAIETAQEPAASRIVGVASARKEDEQTAPTPPQEIKRLLVKTVEEGREVQEFVDLIKQEAQSTEKTQTSSAPETTRKGSQSEQPKQLEQAEIKEPVAPGAAELPKRTTKVVRKVEEKKSNQSDTAMEETKVKAGSGVDSDKADEVSSELPQAETKLSSVFGEKLFPSAAATKGEATLLDEAALEKFTVHSSEEFTLQHSEVSASKTVVIQQSKDSLVMQEESPQKDFTGYDIGSSPTMLAHKVQMPLTPELERDDMLRVEYASEEIGSIQMETTSSMGQLSPDETDEHVASPGSSSQKTETKSEVTGSADSTEEEASLSREVEQIAHKLQEHELVLEEELPLTPDVSEYSDKVAPAPKGPTKEQLEQRRSVGRRGARPSASRSSVSGRAADILEATEEEDSESRKISLETVSSDLTKEEEPSDFSRSELSEQVTLTEDYDLSRSPTMRAHAVRMTEEAADRLLHAQEYEEVLRMQTDSEGSSTQAPQKPVSLGEPARPELTVEESTPIQETAKGADVPESSDDYDVRKSPTMKAHAVKLTEEDADRLLHGDEYMEVLQSMESDHGVSQEVSTSIETRSDDFDIRTSPTMKAHAVKMTEEDADRLLHEDEYLEVLQQQQQQQQQDQQQTEQLDQPSSYDIRTSPTMRAHAAFLGSTEQKEEFLTITQEETVVTRQHDALSPDEPSVASSTKDIDHHARGSSPEALSPTEVKPAMSQSVTEVTTTTVTTSVQESSSTPVDEAMPRQDFNPLQRSESPDPEALMDQTEVPRFTMKTTKTVVETVVLPESGEPVITKTTTKDVKYTDPEGVEHQMHSVEKLGDPTQADQQHSSIPKDIPMARALSEEQSEAISESSMVERELSPEPEALQEMMRATRSSTIELLQPQPQQPPQHQQQQQQPQQQTSTAQRSPKRSDRPTRRRRASCRKLPKEPRKLLRRWRRPQRLPPAGVARDIIEELAEQNDSDEDRAQHKEKTILLTMNDFSSSLEEEILETGSADSLDVDIEAEHPATSTESSHTVQETLQKESEHHLSEVPTSTSAATAASSTAAASAAAAALSSERAADDGRGKSAGDSSVENSMTIHEHPMAFENAAFREDSGGVVTGDVRPGEEEPGDDEEHGQSIRSSAAQLSSSTFTASVETLTITDSTYTTTSTSTTTTITSGSGTVIAQGLSSRQESKDESTISQDITRSASDSGDEDAAAGGDNDDDDDDDEDDDNPKLGVQLRVKRDPSSSDQSKRQSYLSEGSSERDSDRQTQVPSSSEQISSTTHTSEYETASQGSKLTISTSSTTYKTAHSSTQSTISDVSDHSTSHFSTATMGQSGDLSDASDTILESPIGPAGDRREAHQPEESNSPMEELLRRYPYGLPSSGIEADEDEGGYADGCYDKAGMGGMLRKKRLSPILDDHGSTPDADSSSMKRSLGRGSERDDMSVCSLQEFERLEAEMAASKTSVPSSLESSSQLAGGLPSALSSSQPADFERLEREMQLESLSSLHAEKSSAAGMAVIQEHDMSSSQFGQAGTTLQAGASSLSEDDSTAATTELHRSSHAQQRRLEQEDSVAVEQRNEELLDSLIEEIEHQHKDEAIHLDEDKGIEPDSLGQERTPDFPDSLAQSRGEAALYDSLHEVKEIGEWDSYHEGRDELAEIAPRSIDPQRSTTLFSGVISTEQPDSGLFHSDDERTAVTMSSSLSARGPLPADCKQIPESLLTGEILTAAESHTGVQTSVTTRTITEVDYDSEGNPHEKTVTITTTRKVTTDKDGQQHVEETETRS